MAASRLQPQRTETASCFSCFAGLPKPQQTQAAAPRQPQAAVRQQPQAAASSSATPSRQSERVVKLVKGNQYFHWAVKVGDTWYEIRSDKGGKVLKVDVHTRAEAAHGCKDTRSCVSITCKTSKSDAEIQQWVDLYEQNNGGRNETYDFLENNCQHFGGTFVEWLTDGRVRPWTMTAVAKATMPLWIGPALAVSWGVVLPLGVVAYPFVVVWAARRAAR